MKLTRSIVLPYCDRNGIVKPDCNAIAKSDRNGIAKSDMPANTLRAMGTPLAHSIINDLPRNGIAIVGTRKCSAGAREMLLQMLGPFAGSELVVVSGFALGIDRLAHEVALQLGLRTVAILGCGLDTCYPAEHLELQNQILESDGLFISPFNDQAAPVAFHFLKRNYWIAELSHAVWVVEAPFRSGAINTATHAIKLERRLLVTPAHPQSETFSGNLRLLQTGNAEALWHTEDLRSVYSHIERGVRASTIPSQFAQIPQKTIAMIEFIRDEGIESAGPSSTRLQDWWLEQGWTLPLFFETLYEALRNQWIKKENGVYLKNRF